MCGCHAERLKQCITLAKWTTGRKPWLIVSLLFYERSALHEHLRLCSQQQWWTLNAYHPSWQGTPSSERRKRKELFNGRINRNHKKDSENLHRYRGKRTYAGHRALLRKKVNLNPGDLVSLNGEVLVVHSTHTNKKGAVNVEFKTPGKSGQKSASLKKLKIVKTSNLMHSAWTKVS